ncbi:sensor histidine kinase [Solimonas marina]|uniref:histidine kinase n=1 Tax=Solimonas marina TaxID=2714601 RepID=A0A969WCG8_9GAMM|nr:ATP-binding protein [Solimonas marina]NKF24013.1 ATP-binding protein [Solimonas marina]
MAMLLGAALALLLAALLFTVHRLRHERQQNRTLASRLADELRLARVAAAADERERLFADLHDDIGAKLTTLVHALEDPQHADLVRAVVQDFRDIVSRAHQDACTLLEALAQIREETERRLDAVHSVLDWQQAAGLPDPLLDEAQVLHLFRIAREAVTNALRHGHARHIRVRIRAVDQHLFLDFTDDGPGLRPNQPHPGRGRGTSSMRNRAEQLSGTIDWTAGTQGGTKVILEFPLPMPD